MLERVLVNVPWMFSRIDGKAQSQVGSLLGKGLGATLLEQITVPVLQNTVLSTNSTQPPFALIGLLVDQSNLLPKR